MGVGVGRALVGGDIAVGVVSGDGDVEIRRVERTLVGAPSLNLNTESKCNHHQDKGQTALRDFGKKWYILTYMSIEQKDCTSYIVSTVGERCTFYSRIVCTDGVYTAGLCVLIMCTQQDCAYRWCGHSRIVCTDGVYIAGLYTDGVYIAGLCVQVLHT